LPEPDFLDLRISESHISLLTDDGSLTTAKLVESLMKKGWKVVVLSFPQTIVKERVSLADGVNRVVLDDLSEKNLEQQLEAIINTYGPIAAFIHLHPLIEANQDNKIHYLDQEKAIVKHIFLMAKHLKKSLNEAAHKECSFFYTIARLDGAFGLEQTVNFNAVGAGLFGLTKALRFEWESVFCRAIDLSPALDAEQSVNYIIAELHDPNRYLSEVGYGLQRRVTLTCS
jgi:NAD(P)-dependent dehydrogenase (short-subunit alcohol dehydrogenase family)